MALGKGRLPKRIRVTRGSDSDGAAIPAAAGLRAEASGSAAAHPPTNATSTAEVAIAEGEGGAPKERERASVSSTDEPGVLNTSEHKALSIVRRLGTIGALLLAVGSLGAGAAPVINPVLDLPVLRLFARIPTVSLAIAFAGMGMIIIGWLLLGRFARPGRARLATRSELDRTLIMWVTPLLFIPPLFSRDVYGYLAQSQVVHRGMDPYTLSPAKALGVGDPLTVGVPNIWRDTPSPYGPLFLKLGDWVSGITGNHVVLGVLLQRGVAMIGLALIVWSIPRLAKRFGVQPATALWLGAANPLVLFHLVAGAHNDSLAIGLMLAGLEIGIRKLPIRVAGDSPPPLANGELPCIVLGAVIITIGATIKINAIIALGFFAVMIARRRYGRIIDLVKASALITGVCLAVMAVVCFGTGLGFGWIGTLRIPGIVHNWIAPVAELANLGGVLGITLGLGNHTTALVSIFTVLGYATAAVITIKFLWDSFRWRYRPIIGLGVSLGAFMVLHIALHPWYLLWAAIPLAASAGTSRFRVVATVLSAILAVLYSPPGSPFDGRSFVASQAYVAAGVVLVVALFIVRHKAPMLLRWPPSTAKQTPAEQH